MSELKWAYGVTTMPSRQSGFLRQTLMSLAKSGFLNPRLFVDDDDYHHDYAGRLEITFRSPTIRPMGNWWLALLELFIREPHADRYAIFQDDILCCANLREYLERDFPPCGYLNLITWPWNLLEMDSKAPRGWFRAPKRGKGGQGLVFDNQAVVTLLGAARLIRKVQETKNFYRSLDGAVRDSFENAGYTEWVHNPSLLYHLGAMGKSSMSDGKPQPLIDSWLGEDYDPLQISST